MSASSVLGFIVSAGGLIPLAFVSLLCLPQAWASTANAESSAAVLTPLVCFQPLGSYSEQELAVARAGVEKLYGFRTQALAPSPMPESGWYPPRRRHRAEKLLEFLDTLVPQRPECTFFVGLTSLDISTTKEPYPDWGIFGLGEIGGPSAVVSSLRLSRNVKSSALVQERLVKVVNHELGHVLGLDHCPVDRCLMEDAAGTIRTVDRETGAFCEACATRLRARFPIP